jgi:glycine/D-amino acid oxidase-like deaminating enzyme
MQPDVIVIGAGTVGAAIAYGLVRKKLSVELLDGDDGDLRAARANFGLVWLQGKGINMPAYQALTGSSVDLWPEFNRELGELTHTDLQYERNGGLQFCLGEEEFETGGCICSGCTTSSAPTRRTGKCSIARRSRSWCRRCR